MNLFRRLVTAARAPAVTDHDRLALLEQLLREGIAADTSIHALAEGLSGQQAADQARNEARQVVRKYYEQSYARTLSDTEADLVLATVRTIR